MRYSATHRDTYNLLYQLDPIRAYDLRLVKQIEVVDSSSAQNFNSTMVKLNSVGYKGKAKTPSADITIYENTSTGSKTKTVDNLKHGATLYPNYTNRSDYDCFQVNNICAEPGNEYIEFMNGVRVNLTEELGGMTDEMMRSQIRQTIEQHFTKEKKFKDKGIKVLSLFFIDQVNNYRSYDDEGNRQKGKIALWFEEEYVAISKNYKGLIPFSFEEVHDGYFAQDRRYESRLSTEVSSSAKCEELTYELKMKNKKRLLSNDEPLLFIFSHSALREGWDNPNVFQICYLREVGTDMQRRQTLGRGLRLPVNQNGDRIQDEQINRLTVIANETFATFAKGLQDDIEFAMGGDFRFGRVPRIAFTPLLAPTGIDYLSQEQSETIWQHLNTKGFSNYSGTLFFVKTVC